MAFINVSQIRNSGGRLNDSRNSYAVVEFATQAYRQEDLKLFFDTYTSITTNSSPIYLPIDGGYMGTGLDSSTLGESNLDLEFAMSLVYPQPVTLYQVGDDDVSRPASNNNFLDAIDTSYCTYDGGDDPTWDAIYPHNSSAAAYQGQPDCGIYKPASVMSEKKVLYHARTFNSDASLRSISYGLNEASHPAAYFERQCYEYMKLGLMGVT